MHEIHANTNAELAARVLAYEGEPAPGGGLFAPRWAGDPVFSEYGTFFIDDAGNALFACHVAGVAEEPISAIFYYSAETEELSRLIAEGEPCPYPSAGPFTWVGDARLTSNGTILFLGGFKVAVAGEPSWSRRASGVFVIRDGTPEPLVTSEEVVDTMVAEDGVLEGHFQLPGRLDINRHGDLVSFNSIYYYDPEDFDDRYGDPEVIVTGAFIKRAGSARWEKWFVNGDAAPGGGRFDGGYGIPLEVEISEYGHLVAQVKISDDPIGRQILGLVYQAPGEATVRIAMTSYPLEFISAEGVDTIDVQSIDLIGMNAHGQIGMVVRDTSWENYLFIYSEGKMFKVLGYGDESPIYREDEYGQIETYISSGNVMTAAINDNRIPAGEPDSFMAEAVIQSPSSGFGSQFFDVYGYLGAGRLYPIVVDETIAPPPLGGDINLEFADVAINNSGTVGVIARAMDEESNTEKEIVFLTSVDSDSDGLLDVWEENGIDVNSDGTNDFPLHEIGADPLHKDLFVEIDYMESPTCSHKPLGDAVTNVMAAFANAPVSNPDGTNGIRLHIEIDEALSHVEFIKFPDDFRDLKDDHFGSIEERKNSLSIQAKRLAYRYAVFAHQYSKKKVGTWTNTTSSGIAECPGDDLIVSLGGFSRTNRVDKQAATLMHEFGHNLGLRHGGGDDINCKPNYISIMSYSRQFNMLVTNRALDYSRIELPLLSENGLTEISNVGGDAGDETVFFVDDDGDGKNDHYVRIKCDQPIDWNRDGDTNDVGVVKDLNSCAVYSDPSKWIYNGDDKQLQELKGYNDWDNIIYCPRTTAGFGRGFMIDDVHEEMTWELYQAICKIPLIDSTALGPALGIRRAVNGQVELYWADKWNGYMLQSGTISLGTPDWRNETETPKVIEGEYRVTVPASSGSAIFRLMRDAQ